MTGNKLNMTGQGKASAPSLRVKCVPVEDIKEWRILQINGAYCIFVVIINNDCFMVGPPCSTWNEITEMFLRMMDDIADGSGDKIRCIA